MYEIIKYLFLEDFYFWGWGGGGRLRLESSCIRVNMLFVKKWVVQLSARPL